MKIYKPSWTNHKENSAIHSVDIHPDGSRFATGGQGKEENSSSGQVIIWSYKNLFNEESQPKKLCLLDNHLACVNVVRWSQNTGKFLASAGDDQLIIIWKFGGQGLNKGETWLKSANLTAHQGDILDLAWGPRNKYLASCSIDNSIIIWQPPEESSDALKIPQVTKSVWTIYKKLINHTAFVKGICWDPVGSYLASQSDDKSVIIWKTSDWKQDHACLKPFKKSTNIASTLRLDWSPDGQWLVCANAVNNSAPTAQIIQRQTWETELDFVGHRKPITIIKFNPNLYKASVDAKNVESYNVLALASSDKSVSVWTTGLRRPMVVLHDVCDETITDLSWFQSTLLVSSLDGSITAFSFDSEEIGVPLSQKSFNEYHIKTFGQTSLAIEDEGIGTDEEDFVVKSNTLTEKFDEKMMEILEKQEKEKYNDEKKYPKVQVETKTASGKRRIQPKFLAPVDQKAAPFSSPVKEKLASPKITAKVKISDDEKLNTDDSETEDSNMEVSTEEDQTLEEQITEKRTEIDESSSEESFAEVSNEFPTMEDTIDNQDHVNPDQRIQTVVKVTETPAIKPVKIFEKITKIRNLEIINDFDKGTSYLQIVGRKVDLTHLVVGCELILDKYLCLFSSGGCFISLTVYDKVSLSCMSPSIGFQGKLHKTVVTQRNELLVFLTSGKVKAFDFGNLFGKKSCFDVVGSWEISGLIQPNETIDCVRNI